MSPRAKLGILLIIVLAGGLRVGVGLGRQSDVFRWPDSQGNLAIARNVAEGKGFQHTVLLGDTQRKLLADRKPGYPLVLAGLVKFFGQSPALPLVVLQALVAMVGVYLVFLLGRDVGGPIAGMAAAAIMAVHPWQIYFATVALTEVWTASLLAALVLCALRADTLRSPAWTVAAALVLAVLVYFNPAYQIGRAHV